MNSAFRILANEPISRNLVIVVNKNGQVATDDTEALQSLLTSKGSAETGISILRETSPTPSIELEIEQERSERIEMKRQEYLSAHDGEEFDEEELETRMREITGSIDEGPHHVTLNVENYYTPDQARKFANDVLHLGGIDNPQSLMPIDFNFRRKIIQNDHCYTPLTQSPERNEKSQSAKSGKKNVQSKQVKRELKPTLKARQQQLEEDSSDSGEAALDNDEEYEEDQEQSGEEDVSFSESDDDNDMDFSVNDRFGKKGKKKRKYRKHKQKNLTFKDILETGDGGALDDEPKKKYKSPKKVQATSKPAQAAPKPVQITPKPVQMTPKPTQMTPKPTQIAPKLAQMAPKPSTSGKNVSSATSKNTQHIIVKRVAQPLPTFKNHSLRKEQATTTTSQFVPLTISYMKNSNTQLPQQISVQSSSVPTKSKQEIEFVESIVKDLEKSFPETDKKIQPVIIPNIIQMMEHNTPPEMIDQSLATLEHLDSGDGGGIDDLGHAIAAVLGVEAIDELLNHNDLINFDPTQSVSALKMASSLQQSHTNAILPEATTSAHVPAGQLPKILNKQAPAKEPIKVVRNGRVITLPAIEAPTTRGAKRRAQGDSPNTSMSSPVIEKIAKTEKTPSNKDPDSRNSSRRSSLNKSESGKSSRRQSIVQSAAAPDDELDDLNSDGSWASEDDPDRLWCICKQPHNNRFMICCDKCEDWFHGKCVNVTKALGKEYELMGKQWLCPTCKIDGSVALKKSDPNKKPLNQQKLTKFFAKSQKESTDEDVARTTCVVCKVAAARDSSIYCSDECIQNQATKHLDESTAQQSKPSASASKIDSVKRGNVLKDKQGNVIVMDKTTHKILPLSKSPHVSALGQWLSQNPNCEPVKPGSPQAEHILSRRQASSKHSTPTPTPATATTTTTTTALITQVKPIHSTPAEDLFSNPAKIHTGATSIAVVTKKNPPGPPSGIVRTVSVKNAPTPGARTAHAPTKSSSVSTSTKSSSSKQQDSKKLKRQQSDDSPVSNSSARGKIEQERLSVRNILRDTLKQRMQLFNHPNTPKMTDDEIEGYARDTEKAMFVFFNKDTRDKYKAKFRSLKFNLGDVRNDTLLEKICAKKLTPKHLVELQPAALASEELSKWREETHKHELEMITKSELDAMTQTKIVVKTHKGEEIIETKPIKTDILVPIDDVESVIAKSVLSVEDPHGRYDLSRSISLNTGGGNVNSPLSSPSISSSTGRKSDTRHRSRSRSKSRGKSDHHHHHKSSSSSSKHKKGERHRSRSPKHQSNRDKVRKSREKSREQSKPKKSDEHKSRDKSKSRDKDKSSGSSSKPKDHKPKESKPKTEEKTDTKTFDIQPDQQDVDIVGQILGSMGVHLDKPKPKEEKPKDDIVKPEVALAPIFAETKAGPLRDTKPMIEIYSGILYMPDIARFDVTASIVSGDCDDIMKLIPSHLEVVGRIDPATVCDYLDKVKRSPGKELCILRFAATDESKYAEFFNYLHSKGRYGVVKPAPTRIKDFYLFTVKAGQAIPKVLLPFVGPGFVEGDHHRPDLILGVILKITPEDRTKKSIPIVKKVPKPSRPPVVVENPIKNLPSKPKVPSKLTMGLPEFSKTGELQTISSGKSHDGNDEMNDGDEPYTPFDEDDEVLAPPGYNTVTVEAKTASEDFESQMKMINREIEQRQMEIQSLAQQKALELTEDVQQASRIYENISVPHNLSEMLSTISKSQASDMQPMDVDDDDGDDEYVPMSYGYGAAGASYSAASSQPAPIANSMMDIDERIAMFQGSQVESSAQDQPSRLSNMTAADLMAMVPDGALEEGAPPAPKISMDRKQPTIPGLDGDDDFEME